VVQEHTASVSVDGKITLKDYYCFYDEFQNIFDPSKMGVVLKKQYDKETVAEHCLSKQRVKEIWSQCSKKANERYTHGDADNMQIILFEEYLNSWEE